MIDCPSFARQQRAVTCLHNSRLKTLPKSSQGCSYINHLSFLGFLTWFVNWPLNMFLIAWQLTLANWSISLRSHFVPFFEARVQTSWISCNIIHEFFCKNGTSHEENCCSNSCHRFMLRLHVPLVVSGENLFYSFVGSQLHRPTAIYYM